MSDKRRFCRRRNKCRQSGQTTIFVILVSGLFLLAAVGLAIDYSQVWFRRQAAQGAADAACQAGAMDVYMSAVGSATGTAHFTPGTDFTCAAYSSCSGPPQTCPVPCTYAHLNGYSGGAFDTNSESHSVAVSFPGASWGTDNGVAVPPSSLAPVPFIQVEITDNVPLWFSGMVTGRRFQQVRSSAVCGLQEAHAPIPIIVLNPTCQHAFEVSGSAHLQIVGGPTKSVRVNSGYSGSQCATAGSSSAMQCGSGTYSNSCPCPSCQVDLCQGGPDFTGSSFGTFGAAGNPSATFSGGTTGAWSSPAPPISDPFARTAPPSAPPEVSTYAGGGYGYKQVAYHVDGCPDKAGCREYFPGLYNHAIVVQNVTAIFVPGIYYMRAADASANYRGSPSSCTTSPMGGQAYADLAVASNGVVRPAICTGNCSDGNSYPSGGAMFYFTNNSGGMAIVQNAGARASGYPGCAAAGSQVDCFDTVNVVCPGGPAPDNRLNLPTLVGGNVLMGHCTNDGTYTTGAATGTVRGMIEFMDRSISDPSRQTSFQGSGSLLLAGTLYAHNLPGYADFIQLQGTPGSGTFVLGNIVTDELVLSGNGSIAMQLNPNAVYELLKVALLK